MDVDDVRVRLLEGGLSDQPARYVDMNVEIRRLIAESEAKWLELTKPPEKGEGE